MRISDWSSDVCSSDLLRSAGPAQQAGPALAEAGRFGRGLSLPEAGPAEFVFQIIIGVPLGFGHPGKPHIGIVAFPIIVIDVPVEREMDIGDAVGLSIGFHVEHRAPLGLELVCLRQRSEEHTSELQSLMRISYAVFCLKK